MKLNSKELTSLVLASFEAEKNGDIEKGLKLIHKDFTVTDMWIKGETIFPKSSGNDVKNLIKKGYPIKGRKFEFNLIIADEEKQTVVVEFIESYPDPKTKQIYRTVQIAICQIKDGLIWSTRHYCDPAVTFNNVPQEDMDNALS